MFGRSFHRLLAVAGFFSVAAAVWAASGYLPKGGPMPLRFRQVPLLSTNPVSVVAPAPPPTQENMEEESEDEDALPYIPPLATLNADGSPAAVVMEASSPVNRPPPDPVVSPQMFMQYFQASTNANTNSATGNAAESFGFQPPVPLLITHPGPKPAP